MNPCLLPYVIALGLPISSAAAPAVTNLPGEGGGGGGVQCGILLTPQGLGLVEFFGDGKLCLILGLEGSELIVRASPQDTIIPLSPKIWRQALSTQGIESFLHLEILPAQIQ